MIKSPEINSPSSAQRSVRAGAHKQIPIIFIYFFAMLTQAGLPIASENDFFVLISTPRRSKVPLA
jgi:hypothetical protein